MSDQPGASAGDSGAGLRARNAANNPLRRRLTDRRSSLTGEPVPPVSTPPGDQSPAAAPAAYGRAAVGGDDRGPKKRPVRMSDRMDVDSPRSTPPGNRSPGSERNRRNDRQDGNARPTAHSQPPPQQNRRQSLPGPRNDAPPPSAQRAQPTQRAQPNPPSQAFRSQAPPAPAGDVARAFTNNAPAAASTGEGRPRQRSVSSASDPNRRGVAGASARHAGSASAAASAAAAGGAGGGGSGPGGASVFRPRRNSGSASNAGSASNGVARPAAAAGVEWTPAPTVSMASPILVAAAKLAATRRERDAAAELAARQERDRAVAPGPQYIPGGQSQQEAAQRHRLAQVPRYIPGRGNPRAERGGSSSPRSAHPTPASAAAFRSRSDHHNSPASRQQQQRAQDDQWGRANRSPSNPSGGEERDGGGRRRHRGPDYR